jgi:hypothetical protein
MAKCRPSENTGVRGQVRLRLRCDSDGEDNDDEPAGRSLSGPLYAPSVVDDGEPQQIVEVEIEEVQELTSTVTEKAEVGEMQDDVEYGDNEEEDEADIIQIKMEPTEEVVIESEEVRG